MSLTRSITRRLILKTATITSTVLGTFPRFGVAQSEPSAAPTQVDDWQQTVDRVWLGGQCWANPMEDWRVVDGAAECISDRGNRNVQLLTHEITNTEGSFILSVDIHPMQSTGTGGAGFRIGTRSELNEYRSNAFINNGIDLGVIDSVLTIRSTDGKQSVPLPAKRATEDIRIRVTGVPSGTKYLLRLAAFGSDGQRLAEIEQSVSANSILGNVALVSNFDKNVNQGSGARFRFRNWIADGDAFTVDPSRRFGPILWSMYTLSDSRGDEGFVLKMTALTGPMGTQDNKTIELHTKKQGRWNFVATTSLDEEAWTATFRVPNWDETQETEYRLIYQEHRSDGSNQVDEWSGIIKANPNGRPLRLAALTCQHWQGFPYQPVVDNVIKLDPDMLYFSGDQIYESHGGYGFIQEPADRAILCYLRKYYLFGWAFRDALKNAPTVVIPDDHDVFQGNIWGEGGRPMANLESGQSSKGGYREPARMVNVVHKTCASHHPDFADPTPSEQGISVYYGDMVYGNVSFAILGDRQWKSGPDRVNADAPRPDHVTDPNADTKKLDQPGLELLGKRQEKFLEDWAGDWRGHTMKVVLSQTVFAGAATHHNETKEGVYLKADLDSSGWPQTPRNNAIRIMRKGMPLHINGDQHLTTLIQYGVDEQRDSCWSFCTPAISASYQRWWIPDDIGMHHQNRPAHGLPHTGEYVDGLGNKIYVYAVGNPDKGRPANRYARAHAKASGFGFVTIDTDSKTYQLDAFRFLVDATDPDADNQFPGWPVTIHQEENVGRNRLS